MKNRTFVKSAKTALSGFFHALKTERNLRIDVVIAALVLIFAYAYGLDATGYAMLIMTICCVMGAELFNTAIENVSDAVTKEHNKYIKTAKDISAAAVAVMAAGAVTVGVLLFLTDTEKFIMALLNIAFSPRAAAAVIVTAVLGVVFILKYKERNK